MRCGEQQHWHDNQRFHAFTGRFLNSGIDRWLRQFQERLIETPTGLTQSHLFDQLNQLASSGLFPSSVTNDEYGVLDG